MDQYQVPCLRHFNQVLKNKDDLSVQNRLSNNVEMLEEIANAIVDMLGEGCRNFNVSDSEKNLLGDYRYCVLA